MHAHTLHAPCRARTQDFYNLVDVYLDAVFHPRCISDPKVFEQEGWHYELDSPEVRGVRVGCRGGWVGAVRPSVSR